MVPLREAWEVERLRPACACSLREVAPTCHENSSVPSPLPRQFMFVFTRTWVVHSCPSSMKHPHSVTWLNAACPSANRRCWLRVPDVDYWTLRSSFW
jgi:hypothetical protein